MTFHGTAGANRLQTIIAILALAGIALHLFLRYVLKLRWDDLSIN